MQWYRNKEFMQMSFIILSVSAIMVVIGFYHHKVTGILILVTAFLLCVFFYVLTIKRYKNLRRLSEYLRRISSGDTSLDIRDNAEGELSILKSEIYKVTLMLTEYNENLQKEKILLTNHMEEISHQLKTPLTSMMVMVDLLQQDTTPIHKRQEFLSIINTQLERIDWLVAALLKMAKLDAGVVTMKKEAVASHQLLNHALQPFLVTMELKEISYTIQGDNVILECDYHWTTEALINILKNCIEHTKKGGTISLEARDNPLYKEILVSDSGTGITKADLPHIFTRFYRGKNASSDSVGIGLAMSYRIIRMQQGDIQVSSEVAVGTTFSIRLYKAIV